MVFLEELILSFIIVNLTESKEPWFLFWSMWQSEADLSFRKFVCKRESGTWNMSLVAKSVHETNFCNKRYNTAAAHLRHALHVQLNEVSLVVLQDGQAHTKDNL